MFAIIKKRCLVGDYVSISTATGEVFTGRIVDIDDTTIVVCNDKGEEDYILGDDIRSFKKIKNDSTKVDTCDPVSISTPTIPNGETPSDTSKIDAPALSPVDKESSNDEQIEKIDSISSTTSKDVSESASGKPQYKVGDVIPLDQLRRIDPNFDRRGSHPKTESIKKAESDSSPQKTKAPDAIKEVSSPGKAKGSKAVFHDFSELGSLTKEQHELENLSRVPAFGLVNKYFPDRQFGFITDGATKSGLFFHAAHIIDSSLKGSIGIDTPVVYSITQSTSGPNDSAINIHKPGTIKELLDLARELESKGEPKQALSVVEHILKEYPDNFDADRMQAALRARIPSVKFTSKPKKYSEVYNKAKRYHAEKDYDKAIVFYKMAIEEGTREDGAIKDLAMLYAALSKTNSESDSEQYRDIAISFMEEYVDKLPDNITTWNFLENFYYSVSDYENFLVVIDKLIRAPEINKDITKLSYLLSKKAVVLIRTHNEGDAQKVVEDALRVNPENLYAINIKTALENPNSEDKEAAISSVEFNSLQIGLSPFITHTLDDYEEYYGVPPKVIESGEFTDVTLKGIRSQIEKLGRARPRERAKYLLSEAKIMSIIEEDNVVELRSELARYCNAMALNYLYDNSSYDIIRFFYNEAFALEQRWDATSRQVAYYLLTACLSVPDLINITTRNYSPDDALKKILSGDFEQKKWDIILAMFLNNTSITAQITSKLYSNQTYRAHALRALSGFGIKNCSEPISKEDFVKAWDSARDIRKRDYQQLVIAVTGIGSNTTLEECYQSLLELKKKRKEWLTSLDLTRIYSISDNIAPAIEAYVKSSGFRNRDANHNNASGQIRQLIEEITEGPTAFSYDALLPLMENVLGLLDASFQEVIKQSEPKITMTLLSGNTVIGDNNIVSIQISISNHKDSSQIREPHVSIVSDEDIQYIEEENESSNAIYGGENRIFKLKIKVSDKVIRNKAAALESICKYKTGSVNEFKEKRAQLSLKLYSPEDFKPIDNPYAAVADGGPVPVTSHMFYGREDFIKNVADSIIKAPSKQVIIYGQKRCGKSSVMLHLKERLMSTGKAFCIFFSLGEIINNLTEAAFYHKILSTIQLELEALELDGLDIPNVEFPKYADFKAEDPDNPLNTFTIYMTRFKRACKKTPGWEEKNLVVMIDEFTYLYTEIKHGHISPSIMKQWKAITQNENAQFSVVLVGQDVVPSFKKEDYARNAFGVIQDIRLTYLQDEPARELIENPIKDENGMSRYIGDAINRIIDYTSRNPYYIQIFCARLVDYMNKNNLIVVTEADVNDVAKSFIKGDQALEEDKFDNLIRAGETEDLQEYPEDEIRAILHAVALGTKNIPYCSRDDINTMEDKERENDVLKNLVDREVLEKMGKDNYKIQVKLFQEWLLNH